MTEKEFAQNWVEEKKNSIKNFPGEFFESTDFEEVELPGRLLILGPEIFGGYELMDSGNDPVMKVDDINKAKYILYANRLKPASTKIPKSEEEITAAIKRYEKYLDEMLESIQEDFKKHFPQAKTFPEISNFIFNSLNLKRL